MLFTAIAREIRLLKNFYRHEKSNLTNYLGAGPDVTNPEPNPLLSMENAAVLPHIGSATIEARNAMSCLSAESIIQGLRGVKLPYIVNPEVYSR